jgi:phage head maturation protease
MKIIKIKKFFPAGVVTIKSVNEEEMTVDAVVSTKSTDRDGDIIEPEALRKRLKHFKQHPVMVADHDYQIMKQIGEAQKISIDDKEGIATKFKYYAGEGNQFADWAFVLAKKGRAAYSIGFMAHDWEWITEKDKESGQERYTGRRFKDIELLEISQVVVGSNRDALQADAQEAEVRKELAEMVIKGIDAGEIQIPELPKKAVKTICCHCKHEFDYGSVLEISMGAVACPKCGKHINQEGKSIDQHYSETVLGGGTAEEQTKTHLPQWDEINSGVKDRIKEALKQ